jgi:uncharacterized protein (TIGR03437 family)
MRKLLSCCALLAARSASIWAGPFHPQTLFQIPSQPGQQISSVQIDSQGNTIATAIVTQTDVFDVTSAFGLVIKLDPRGNEIFSRVLPALVTGEPSPPPLVVALDGGNNIYVGGQAAASDSFPFTSILNSSGGFAIGGFLIKLNGADGTLAYATALNGYPTSLIVEPSGEALMTLSSIVQLPVTTGAYSHGSPGGFSPTVLMYIQRLSQAGDSVLLSALYSGSGVNCATPTQCQNTSAFTAGSQIMEDTQSDIWIAGNTNTPDLPTTLNALKSTCGCSQYAGDAFLAEFSNDGTKLLYATYLGTSSPDVLSSIGEDDLTAAAMDNAGNIWIVGSTNGSDFPVTSNAIQQLLAGGTDGFIARYDPATNQLLYASYFGGAANDSIANVQIASDGTVIIAGHSQSSALPIAASGFTRGPDFLAIFDPQTYAGTFLTTFPSGSAGTGLASAPAGMEAIAGTSNVVDFLAPGLAAAGTPSLYAVTSSANFVAAGQVAPGELITLFGANVGPSTPVTADLSSGLAPTQLGGVQVMVLNSPVPILYAQQDQINAIIPFSPAGSDSAPNALGITVNNTAAASDPANLGFVYADPEAFVSASYAAALNQDGTVNSQTNPAAGGSTIAIFATGLGGFSPPLTDGSVVKTAVSMDNLLVLYNGAPLTVTYSGQAPMLIAGVSQVNFVLPPAGGNSTLTFQFGVYNGASGWTGMPFDIWVK